MSTELKEAAEKALVVLGSATSFMSRKARDQHESVVAELRTALSQHPATSEPVAWFEYSEQHKSWFLAYTRNPHVLTRPLVFGDTHLAPGVPDGWQLVPIEPTAEMLQAALKVATPGALRAAWARMLAASTAQKGGECLPIRGNQVTCSRGTGGCGIQHKGGD